MIQITRILKNLLIAICLLLLGFGYYELSDRTGLVTLYKDSKGNPLGLIDTDMFFYIPGIFVVVINVLISMMAKLMAMMPFEKLNIPNKDYWMEDEDHRERLNEIMISWVYVLAIIINIFCAILIIKVWFTNRNVGGQPYEYGLLSLTFLLVMLGWGVFPFYRLRIRKEEIIE